MAVNINMGSTLQSVTNAGNTTDQDINVSNGTVIVKLGMASATATYFGNTTNHDVQFKSNNSTYGVLKANGSWAMGDGTNSNAAVLRLNSTSRGFMPPVMTTTQKNAISSPLEGLVVYDATLHKLCVYNGSAWETVTSA